MILALMEFFVQFLNFGSNIRPCFGEVNTTKVDIAFDFRNYLIPEKGIFRD